MGDCVVAGIGLLLKHMTVPVGTLFIKVLHHKDFFPRHTTKMGHFDAFF